MKKIFLLYFAILTLNMYAVDTVQVKQTKIPILIDRIDNVLFYLRIDAKESKVINEVVLDFADVSSVKDIKAVKLYYGGTEASQRAGNVYYAPVQYISGFTQGKTKEANPSYSVKVGEKKSPGQQVKFSANYKLVPGINYFWVSL